MGTKASKGKTEITAYVHQGSAPTQEPDTATDGNYYVSVVDGPRVNTIVGPFAKHADALAYVEPAKKLALAANPWAHFYAFGTVKTKLGFVRPGMLNERLGVVTSTN